MYDDDCTADKNNKYGKIIRLADLANDFPELAPELDKLIAEATGVRPIVPPKSLDPTITELRELRFHGKISAIKLYRERTGESLKDSKEALEHAGIRIGILERQGDCVVSVFKRNGPRDPAVIHANGPAF